MDRAWMDYKKVGRNRCIAAAAARGHFSDETLCLAAVTRRPSVRSDEIVSWVKKKTGPPVVTLRRMAEYQEAKKQTVYFVAFFDEFEVRVGRSPAAATAAAARADCNATRAAVATQCSHAPDINVFATAHEAWLRLGASESRWPPSKRKQGHITAACHTDLSLTALAAALSIPCLPQGEAHTAFTEAAKVVEDVPFYQTTDLSVAKKVGITKPGFVLTRNYPGAYGESAFLKEVRRPLGPPRSS